MCQFCVGRNAVGWTPTHCAAFFGHDRIIELLISAKAEFGQENTPLHLAARKGHLKAVKVLLKNNADPGAVTSDGENPLDLAIENGHK